MIDDLRGKNRLIAIVILAIVLIGVGSLIFLKTKSQKSTSNLSSTRERNLPVVRVAVTPPGAVAGIIAIAKESGFDKEEGFVFDAQTVNPSDYTVVLMGGGVEVSQISPIQLVKVNEEGGDLRILAPSIALKECGLFVKEGSKIKNWQDLKGKKVGTLGSNSGSYLSLATAMGLHGYKLEEYYKTETLPFPGLIPALAQNKVEAVFGPCGAGSLAQLAVSKEVDLAGSLADVFQGTQFEGKPIQVVVLAVREKWSSENSDLAVRVQKVIYKSMNYLKDNPDEFDKEYMKQAYGLENNEQVSLAKEYSESFLSDLPSWDELKEHMLKFLYVASDAKIIASRPTENIFLEVSK